MSLNFLSTYLSNSGRTSSSHAASTLSKSLWSSSVSLMSFDASSTDLANSFSMFGATGEPRKWGLNS